MVVLFVDVDVCFILEDTKYLASLQHNLIKVIYLIHDNDIHISNYSKDETQKQKYVL
jgi:hypothetical protein